MLKMVSAEYCNKALIQYTYYKVLGSCKDRSVKNCLLQLITAKVVEPVVETENLSLSASTMLEKPSFTDKVLGRLKSLIGGGDVIVLPKRIARMCLFHLLSDPALEIRNRTNPPSSSSISSSS